MSGSQKIAHSQDVKRIDINDTYEMCNWCAALRCSEKELEKAIRAVGNSATAVKEFLGKSHVN
jgi:hypothetical protein